MRKFNRLLGTAFAIAVASAVVAFGCGGSSYLTEAPPEVTGGPSYPVSISGGIEADSAVSNFGSVNASASKDVEGEGIIEGTDGAITGPSEDYQIYPWIECSATTNLYSYDVVYNVADCTYPDQCLVVTREFTDATLHSLQFHIDGKLPDAAEADDVDCTVIMNHRIRTDRVFASDAIRINAFVYDLGNGWSEIGQAMIDQTAGVNFDLAPETYGTGVGDHLLDSKDMLGCDGVLNGGYLNMEIDPTTDPFPGGINTSLADSFTMGISLVETDPAKPRGDMIDDPNDGSSGYRCDFQTLKPLTYEFVGLTTTGVNLVSDPLKECGRYCNDIAVNCDTNWCSEAEMDTSAVAFVDADHLAISDGQEDVMIGPEMGVSFGVEMDESTVTDDHIFMTVTADPLPAGLNFSNIAIGNPYGDPLDVALDGVTGDDFLWAVEDAYEYQLLPLEIEALGVKTLGGAMPFYPIAVNVTAGCATSDTFNVDSSDPVECWDPSVTYANFFPVTLNTWAQIDAESALQFDLVNGMLLYRDSGKGDDTQQAAFISKPIELPSSSWQLEAVVSNASGFKAIDVGTMSDALSFNVMSDVTSGYTMGLQTIDIVGVKTQTCYALYMENGVPQGGSYLDDCDTESDFVFRLSYNVAAKDVVAEVSFDDGASWHDIVTEGVQFPTAPQAALNYAALAGNVYGSIGIMSADDGTTKNNTADIEQVRFYGLDSLAGAAVAQFSDGDYEEPDTFAMNLGGVLLDVQDGGNWNSIDPNGTNARMDQNVVAIFDESISPLDFANMTTDNIYLTPVEPLTGQAATVPGAVYGTIMDPGGEYENMRAAYIEITDAASIGQQVGDSGAYHYQKQDMELHIKGQAMENGLAQRDHYVHPFSPACALSDHFYQDLRTQCYYTVSNTDVSTAIAAGGSVLEITRTGAAGVYEISKPAKLNMSNEWVLSIKVNIDNMDRDYGSVDGIMLRLTDSNGEGYHIGVMAYDSIVGGGDSNLEMTCVAGRTNNLGQFIEFAAYAGCDTYDGQDLVVQLQASYTPGQATPFYSLDGGQTLIPFPSGYLGLLTYETWTDVYMNLETTFSPTSSMQVDLDRINSLGHIGRSAAELDTTDYMVEPWGRPPKK